MRLRFDEIFGSEMRSAQFVTNYAKGILIMFFKRDKNAPLLCLHPVLSSVLLSVSRFHCHFFFTKHF